MLWLTKMAPIPLLLEQGADLEDQLHPHLGIDVGEGLIQQHQPRLAHQCPGDGHPLLLTTGELVRIAIPQPLQIDQRQRLVHLLLASTAIEFGQAKADIVGHRQVGKEGVILKDHADVARLGRHAGTRPVEQGIAEANRALCQRQQPGDGLQQRGFAAATGSQQADDLVVCHRQGELLQHIAAVVTAADIFNLQTGQG